MIKKNYENHTHKNNPVNTFDPFPPCPGTGKRRLSGLNNLEDISLDNRYSAICGYTRNELESVFKEPLKLADLNEIKEWYNGYNFLGEPVYNPFDVLLYLKSGKFRNYWFETGSPSFLIKLIQDRKYYVPVLESFHTGDEIPGSFEIDNLSLETILFQTGYITIKSRSELDSEYVYTLSYPNLEVKKSLNRSLKPTISGKRNDKSQNGMSEP
ncbi:MAG: AAA family ATPase [Deltaproteobacteria bacterium]|nr:AAA family ATPase [Deltaproteobacteria bacterium]